MTMTVREFISKFPKFRLTGSRGYQRSIELLSFGGASANANWASNHPRRDWDFVTDDAAAMTRAKKECSATQLPCVSNNDLDDLTVNIYEFHSTDNDPQLVQLILVRDAALKFATEQLLFPYLYEPWLGEVFNNVDLRNVQPLTKDKTALRRMWNSAYELTRELRRAAGVDNTCREPAPPAPKAPRLPAAEPKLISVAEARRRREESLYGRSW